VYGVAALVSNCTITGNAAINGGGLYFFTNSSVTACRVTANRAYAGGGAYCSTGGSVTASTLIGNSATYGGGGYCVVSGILSHCTLASNTAGYGGGVFCWYGGLLDACTLSGNSVSNNGGGAYCYYGGLLRNCLLTDWNSSDEGGGVYCLGGGDIMNCTISSNHASTYGGGVRTYLGGTIVNSIIYFNEAGQGGDNWHDYNQLSDYSFCCITPTSGLPNGAGCIAEDPQFMSPGTDYRITYGSPCRDAGTNQPWMVGATDLAGMPRIYGGIVDMGCYEWVPEPAAAMAAVLALLVALRRSDQSSVTSDQWSDMPDNSGCATRR
jgi:hypothetical protein